MEKNLHIGDKIKKELRVQDLSISWLARKLECDASNLNKKLKSPKMKFDVLKNISSILGKNFCNLYLEF